MVLAFGRALPGKLGVLGLEGGQLELPEMVLEQHLRRVAHAALPLHATTRRVVDQHFAEERPALIAHPTIPYSAVLTIERRVSREGMVSVGGNLYSVPDTARKRVLDVQNHPSEVRCSATTILSGAVRKVGLAPVGGRA